MRPTVRHPMELRRVRDVLTYSAGVLGLNDAVYLTPKSVIFGPVEILMIEAAGQRKTFSIRAIQRQGRKDNGPSFIGRTGTVTGGLSEDAAVSIALAEAFAPRIAQAMYQAYEEVAVQ